MGWAPGPDGMGWCSRGGGGLAQNHGCGSFLSHFPPDQVTIMENTNARKPFDDRTLPLTRFFVCLLVFVFYAQPSFDRDQNKQKVQKNTFKLDNKKQFAHFRRFAVVNQFPDGRMES